MGIHKHKGLRHYSGEEAGNLAIGGLGVEQLTVTASIGESGNKSGEYIFVAIKAVGALPTVQASDVITFTAQSLNGDDLGSTSLFPGDMFWGCFNYVNITANTGNRMKLLVYKGK
tara:strand:- start:6161 stop:6505 length:345 start_codon:yes stop_codon:yes gene_type:complete